MANLVIFTLSNLGIQYKLHTNLCIPSSISLESSPSVPKISALASIFISNVLDERSCHISTCECMDTWQRGYDRGLQTLHQLVVYIVPGVVAEEPYIHSDIGIGCYVVDMIQ